MAGRSESLARAAADSGAGAITLLRVALSGWFNPQLTRAVAANSAVPRSVLWFMAMRRWDVRAAAAANPRCPRVLLRVLALSSSPGVSAAVACSALAPTRLLRHMADVKPPCVRIYIALNPSLTSALADRLVADSDSFVRGAAAAHAAVSAGALRQLGAGLSEPAWILRAVATNSSCPADLSDELLTWIAIGGSAHADPMFDPVACTGHPADTRVAAAAWYAEQARRPLSTGHALWRVRAAVLRASGRVGPALARDLAEDPQREVRLSIARAQRLPVRVIQLLTHDAAPEVARLASDKLSGRSRPTLWLQVHRGLVSSLAMAAIVGLLLWTALVTQDLPSSGTGGQASSSVAALQRLITSGRGLPDGGRIGCGVLSDTSITFVLVTVGTRPLTLRPPSDASTASGQPLRNPVVPAGGHIEFFVPSGPSPITVAVSPQDMAKVVVTLTGCS